LQLTIIGAGAIGGTIGAHMARAGHEILLCDTDREHVEAINRDGLTIEGPVGNFTVRLPAVTPDQLPARLDKVGIAVKSHHTQQAAELLRGRLAPDGYVVSLQNGLNAAALSAVVGEARVLLGFVNFGADLMGPGRIMQGNVATFRVGEINPGPVTPRVRELAGALPYAEATENIMGFLWSKEAYGAMLFAGAVSDLPISATLEQQEWRPLMLAVAREVLAQAPVHCEPFDGFDPSDLEGSLGRLAEFNRRSAKSHSGIYRDLMVRHRPTEVDGQLADLKGPLTHHVAEIIRAIERGERTCEVANLVLVSALHRAEETGRELQAVVHLISAPLRARTGPLLGVPVAVKDLFDVRGLPRGNGNPEAMAGPPASSDSALVAQLRTAAADVFATTAMLEYAAGATHPAVPETLNPWDRTRTAGGSSGGSASLVAAGVCPAALGTDTGGSVRIPAAYCGIVGFKPTHGLLSQAGVQPLAPTLDDVGIVARDVATVQQVLGTLVQASSPARGPLALGYIPSQFRDPRLEGGVSGQLDAARERLQNAGVTLVERGAGVLYDLDQLFDPIFLYEAWQVHGPTVEARPGHFGPETLRLLRSGRAVGLEEYRAALDRREGLLAAFSDLFSGVDGLLTPAVPFVAPRTTPPVDTPEGEAEAAYTRVVNVAGAPATTLPCGLSEGMPVSIQLVGNRGSDWPLLGAAAELERLLGFDELGRLSPVAAAGRAG
jgi:2-dehydropantoate 2-reductase